MRDDDDDDDLVRRDPDEEDIPAWSVALIGRKQDMATASIDEHVDYAANLMRTGAFGAGSYAVLAQAFQKPLGYLKKVVAEAGRRVTSEALDRDKVQAVVSKALEINLHKAMSQNKLDSVVKTAAEWSKIVGARAPERHEHAVIVAHYDAMSPRNKVRWIDDNIAKLQAKREELLSIVGDENDAFEPQE